MGCRAEPGNASSMENLFLPGDNISIADRVFLVEAQCDSLQRWLPTKGGAIVVYDPTERWVEIHAVLLVDIDRLVSIEADVVQQARMMVGVDRVALYFARREICVLGESVESRKDFCGE